MADDFRIRLWLGRAWAALLLMHVAFLGVFTHDGPIIDEWAFIDVLVGDESAGRWAWAQHNEHRFVLPKLLWLGLMRLGGDFRVGCWVTLLGLALVGRWAMSLARQARGRAAWPDLFLPASLMHLGHGENFRMGYQINFLVVLALSLGLIAAALAHAPDRPWRTGWRFLGLTSLLALCGATGLALIPPTIVGLIWAGVASARRGSSPSALGLFGGAAGLAAYVWLYAQGYERPAHHPPPGDWLSILSVSCQALAIGTGPAVIGWWPVSGLLAPAAVWVFLWAGACLRIGRGRWVWLGLALVGFGGVGLGIGVGRSGWPDPEFGFAARYGWLTWPLFGTTYYALALIETRRSARVMQWLFAALALLSLPGNSVSGVLMARKEFRDFDAWERAVRDGGDLLTAARLNLKAENLGPGGDAEYARDAERLRAAGLGFYGGPDLPGRALIGLLAASTAAYVVWCLRRDRRAVPIGDAEVVASWRVYESTAGVVAKAPRGLEVVSVERGGPALIGRDRIGPAAVFDVAIRFRPLDPDAPADEWPTIHLERQGAALFRLGPAGWVCERVVMNHDTATLATRLGLNLLQ